MNGLSQDDVTVVYGPAAEVYLLHRPTGRSAESAALPTTDLNYFAALGTLRESLSDVAPANLPEHAAALGRHAQSWHRELALLAFAFVITMVVVVMLVF